MGLRCIMYIDDGICAFSSRIEYVAAKQTLLADLERAGFVLSIDNCVLEPVQNGIWLGFSLNLLNGSFCVPHDKIARFQACIHSLNLDGMVHVKTLASIVGQIISMSVAIGPVARLRTRAL